MISISINLVALELKNNNLNLQFIKYAYFAHSGRDCFYNDINNYIMIYNRHAYVIKSD